jgi:DNA-binding MarR family transcriptional regulator
MVDLREKLGQYLHDVLDITVTFALWEWEDRLPLFLVDRYRFFTGDILNQRCLFMTDTYAQEESPATIRKHVEQVRGKWDDRVVYVRERITAYNRKRLIEHRVPFIVPGNQMFLPTLGIDLREHFRKRREEGGELGPAAQTVLIHALLQSAEDLGPTVLAKRLGYSVMTMSRALDELEAAGLGQSSAFGRARRLRLAGSKRDVWEKAQPALRSPVRTRQTIRLERDAQGLPGLRSGLTALAHYSMLAEPTGMTLALSREEWVSLRKEEDTTPVLPDEPDGVVVEVWTYAPAMFTCEGCVDRLSLYLSLRTTEDERIRAALNQMLKEVAW